MGSVMVVWMPALNYYLLVAWYSHHDFAPGGGMALIVYDAPRP